MSALDLEELNRSRVRLEKGSDGVINLPEGTQPNVDKGEHEEDESGCNDDWSSRIRATTGDST